MHLPTLVSKHRNHILAAIVTALVLAAAYAAGQALADTPAALKARRACPSLTQCRSALISQIKATDWQKRARNHARAGTSRDVVLDAIQWASRITGVPAWRLTNIGTCESHLFWKATNGQYKGWGQLSARHRRDPVFRVVPWQDPYAQAIHIARYIKRYGAGEWQCTEYGGLRW